MAKQKNKGVKGRKTKVVTRVKDGMDAAAKAYAAMLLDPCGAPLSRPIYSGTGTGYLIRVQSSLTLDLTTFPNARVALFPGVYDPTTPAGPEVRGSLSWNQNSASNAVCVPYTQVLEAIPGYSFLGQVSTFRPVAACMEITYTGANDAMRGMIGVRQTDYANTFYGTSTIDQALMGSEKAGRVTEQTTTIRWVPSSDDQDWTNQIASSEYDGAKYRDETGVEAAIVGGTGFFNFKCVVIYEWHPKGYGSTLTGVPRTPSPSRNTVTQVLQYLQGTGDWAYQTSEAGARAASAMYRGVMGLKALAGGLKRMAVLAG